MSWRKFCFFGRRHMISVHISDMDLISCCFDPVILGFSEEYWSEAHCAWGPNTCKLFKSSLLCWAPYDQKLLNTIRTVSLPFDDDVNLVSIGKPLGFSMKRRRLGKSKLQISVKFGLLGFSPDCRLWHIADLSNIPQTFPGGDSSSFKYHGLHASLLLFNSV